MDVNCYPQTQFPRRKKRKTNPFKTLILITLIIIVGAITTVFLCNNISLFYAKSFASSTNTSNSEDWALVLANSTHPVSEKNIPELTTLSNGNQVDLRIYPSLQKMFDDARKDGIYPTVTSGYRSKELQQQLYNEEIAKYQSQGLDYNSAEETAKKWVTLPGTSEHQTGLAVDISAAPESGQDPCMVYEWLENNGSKYGFILRYPENKTNITGINYEPWHY